jgi:hypothetical protein
METRGRLQRLETVASRPAFAWAVAIVLGLLNAVPVRFVVNPDGISYLNLATLYQHGDWMSAINGYWSPLYPLLLAVTLRVIPVSDYLESTVVHGLNVAIYLGAFAAFRFFLSEVRGMQEQERATAGEETSWLSFGSLTEIACAHALFFWAALSLVGFALVTPDMTVMLLLFIAGGLTIRLRRNVSAVGYAGLGGVIGLAYLTKAVMFPLGIVMCLCCGLPDTLSKAARRSALAFAGFILVASPQVAAMSWLSGHLSYGESGTVAYANEVNHVPKFWVGELPGFGAPQHAMRQLSRSPASYEFSLPNTTFSYPVSDQLAHWMQGVRPRFSIAEQVRVTNPIISWYIGVFDVLIVATLVLLFLKRRIRSQYIALIVPALAAFAIYALVYAETRYLGASVVLLFVCFAASVQFYPNTYRGALAVAAALAVYYGISSVNQTRNSVIDIVALIKHDWPQPQMETASDLRRLGVKQGSRVAAIGYAFSGYWARLAGVQIAMQVPDGPAYARATDSDKASIIDAFRKAGAVAVVSVGPPTSRQGEVWRRIGPAGYWVLLLSQQDQAPPSTF